jgi:DNA excision repair protein ERCC-2
MGIPNLDIDGLAVPFPYDSIYPEQLRYMWSLKKTIDNKGQGLLEMPTGTGKTVAVMSLICAYQYAHPEVGKLVFCTRTVPEMTKALKELRVIMEYRNSLYSEVPRFLAVGISARKNMCVHPTVSRLSTADAINARCRVLTSGSGDNAATDDVDMEDKLGGSCSYYEKFKISSSLKNGVYTIDDLKSIGLEEGWCPYYFSRKALQEANVVVFSYQYLLDAGVAAATPLFDKNLGSSGPAIYTSASVTSDPADPTSVPKEPAIVVFDEAHNIDDVCIESMTVKLNRHTLDSALSNLRRLNREVESVRQRDANRLKQEYDRLVQGLVAAGDIDPDIAARIPVPNVLPTEGNLARLLVPGSIRKAENFLSLLQAVLAFLKQHIISQKSKSEGTLMFCHRIEEAQNIDSKTLKSFSLRLRSLLNTLKIIDVDQYVPIAKVCEVCSLAATHARGFAVLVDPYPEMEGVYDPQIELSCLDASIAMRMVTDRFSTVVLTSGTLSPLTIYPKLLNLSRVIISESLSVSLARECIRPMVVTRSNDQTLLSSKFDLRNDGDVIRGYGSLLEELTLTVPDGIVVFFPSKMYIRSVVQIWFDSGILTRLCKLRPVFFETEDVVETTIALANYRTACDQGRGGIFISVARGKVSEGIDFDRHYGRCVVLCGVPYQNYLSRRLRSRLEYLQQTHGIQEQEFLTFDAMRAAAQCVGRVIRSKQDYGIMVFADYRYARSDKRGKLPEWIRKFLVPSLSNLTVDMASASAREFLLHMSQPFVETTGGENPSKLTIKDLDEYKRKIFGTSSMETEAEEIVLSGF